MTAPHSNTPSKTPSTAPDQWADIGVNLTDRQFHDDRDTVIERAAAAGVAWQLITGTSIDESRAAIALADEHPSLFATAGLHPHSARFYSSALEKELRELLAHEQTKAAGE